MHVKMLNPQVEVHRSSSGPLLYIEADDRTGVHRTPLGYSLPGPVQATLLLDRDETVQLLAAIYAAMPDEWRQPAAELDAAGEHSRRVVV